MPIALAVGLLSLLAAMFLMAFSTMYKNTLGEFLRQLALALQKVTVPGWLFGPKHPLAFAAHALESIDNAVRRALGYGISGTMEAWNYALHYSAVAVQFIGHELALGAEDTYRAINTVVAHTIPQAVTRATAATKARVTVVEKHVAGTVVHVAPVVRNYITKVERVTVVKSAAVAGALSLPRLGRIEHDALNVEKRVTNLAKRLTPAAIVALIGATIFKHFRLGWLRCPGVNRVGRGLCGMTGLIESLFADAVAAFLVTDLCAFVAGLQSAAQQAQPFLLAFVDVEDALIGCHGATKPAPIPLPGLSRTPVVDAVAL